MKAVKYRSLVDQVSYTASFSIGFHLLKNNYLVDVSIGMIIFALPLHAAVGELALVDLFGGRRELSIAVLPPPPPLPLVRLARAVSHFALPVPLVVGELPRVYVAAFGTACEGRSFVRSID
jgi:hypothetical protein